MRAWVCQNGNGILTTDEVLGSFLAADELPAPVCHMIAHSVRDVGCVPTSRARLSVFVL
jgi:hypothetical protein